MSKSCHRPGTGMPDHVVYNRNMDLFQLSLGQPGTAQPDIPLEHFRSQLGQLCNGNRWVHMPTMLRILKTPWGQTDDRRGPPTGAQPVWRDPSAGGKHGCANLGKLIQRQGLLIPWYLEDKDCDYLHVPRQVGAPAANAASHSSGPESFAAMNMSAQYNIASIVCFRLTEVRVRYAVIQ